MPGGHPSAAHTRDHRFEDAWFPILCFPQQVRLRANQSKCRGGNTSCGPSQGPRDAECWKEREGSWPGRRFRRANREGEESRGKALAEEGQEDLGKIQVVELAARSDLRPPLLPGDALLLLISGDSHIAYGFHTGPLPVFRSMSLLTSRNNICSSPPNRFFYRPNLQSISGPLSLGVLHNPMIQ